MEMIIVRGGTLHEDEQKMRVTRAENCVCFFGGWPEIAESSFVFLIRRDGRGRGKGLVDVVQGDVLRYDP